jgi:signal transduction histidine kinase
VRKLIRSIVTSVFTKLLAVIVVAGVAVNALVFGAFGYAIAQAEQSALHRNIAQYVVYLVDDIGWPPDPRRVSAIAARTSLDIRLEGPWGSVSTVGDNDKDEKPFAAGPIHWYGEEFGVRFGRAHGLGVVEARRGETRYLFRFDSDFDDDGRHHWIVLVTFYGVSLILLGAYLFMRRLLRPISHLGKAAVHVGYGDFSYRAPMTGSREFVRLSEAFNAMTERIGAMVTAKERLLLDVSHELRTPLTRMNVGLEFLPESDVRAGLKGDVAEMDRMVHTLLETARLQNTDRALKKEIIDVADLLTDVTALFAGEAPGVTVVPPPPGTVLFADRERIATVLRNLIANGLKYSFPTSGPVRVEAEMIDRKTVIRVIDDGEGIAEEELPYIFEPFYRIDRSRSKETGGYGLGLSLCKTIMESHAGTIDVASADGHGATFTLTLLAPE